MTLHTYITYGLTRGPLVAAVQRHNLTPIDMDKYNYSFKYVADNNNNNNNNNNGE
jgi:hypothetical protein